MASAYLCKSSLEGRHTARVAWETVILPKDQGGLGVKNLEVWNRTCSIKLIWMLFCRTKSIWVAWIHQNVIKDQSFWEIKPNPKHTWLFKQLLKLRTPARNWIRNIPGNGVTCSFWNDIWSPFGRLIDHIGPAGPRRTGIHINSTLASLWCEGSWILPAARSSAFEAVLIHLTSLTLSDQADSFEWRIDNQSSANFNSSQIYHLLREVHPTVPWHKVIWLKRGIPKHKTFTWQVLLNRCPTRDRIISWGLQTDLNCLLCNAAPETRDHLFFSCIFSKTIISNFTARFELNLTSYSWPDLLTAFLQLPISSNSTYLLLLSWQASAYEIWRERNNRLHRNSHRHPDSIISTISLTVKNRISAFRDQNPVLASAVLQLWFDRN